MTPEQRADRARRAEHALAEFVEPFLDEIERDYSEKIISVAASSDPRATEIVTRLANGISVARQLRAKFMAEIAEGGMMQARHDAANRFEGMTPSDLRLLNIGR